MLKESSLAGFLLIELLLALAMLVSLIATIGYWQWQILQQERALAQYLQALVIADNSLARLLAGDLPRQSQSWQQAPYTITTQVQRQSGSATKAFQSLQLQVSWHDCFTQHARALTLISGTYA